MGGLTGVVALGETEEGETVDSRPNHIARVSSSTAAITGKVTVFRNVVGRREADLLHAGDAPDPDECSSSAPTATSFPAAVHRRPRGRRPTPSIGSWPVSVECGRAVHLMRAHLPAAGGSQRSWTAAPRWWAATIACPKVGSRL